MQTSQTGAAAWRRLPWGPWSFVAVAWPGVCDKTGFRSFTDLIKYVLSLQFIQVVGKRKKRKKKESKAVFKNEKTSQKKI